MSRGPTVDLTAAAEAPATSGHPALRLRHVHMVYGTGVIAVQALRDVSLDIVPGQFVVLLGPSGSGKTTLLKLEAGRQVLGVLRDLAREGHHTVLLVTHNSAIASMADRVVWLHSGAIAREQRVDRPLEAEELGW